VFLVSCTKKKFLITPELPPQTITVKTLGGSKNESATSVVKTQDGGYLVLGYTQSIDGDVITSKTTVQYDYWLLKFDNKDSLEWQKTLGGTKDDKAYKVITTNDNGFAIVGYSKSNNGDVNTNAGFEDVWIVKLNSTGNILWKTNTGFSGSDKGNTIVQTTDGGFFVGGLLDVTASGGLGNSKSLHAGGDYWGIKLSSNGTIEWRRYFGGANTDTCYDVLELDDGYLMIGSSDSIDVDIKNNKGSYDFWVIKIDKTGTLIWEKSYGGKEIEESYQVVKTPDNNFLLVGETRSSDQDVKDQYGGADVWVVKIDQLGNLIWEKNYGGSNFDAAKSVKITKDGNYLIAGNSRSSNIDVVKNNGENDVWLLKIYPSGDLIWQKTIGGSNIDLANDIVELEDKSIVVVGESNSNDKDLSSNKGFTDLLIVRLK
jgi:hypothetical protein